MLGDIKYRDIYTEITGTYEGTYYKKLAEDRYTALAENETPQEGVTY